MYVASAMAANTICRTADAAGAPLFTQYTFDELSVGGGGSIIGGVAVLLMPIPFVFYRYREEIRRRSKFAPISMELDRLEDKEQPRRQVED
jgi:MFS transporter, DHA1 family, multidrug resistance protein